MAAISCRLLRIASGDIIDVDTLLTNTPAGLAKASVSNDKIQQSLKSIVNDVTGDHKGPGGHILTGPVYVEGAEPGDVLVDKPNVGIHVRLPKSIFDAK